jgi:hypothetical protein
MGLFISVAWVSVPIVKRDDSRYNIGRLQMQKTQLAAALAAVLGLAIGGAAFADDKPAADAKTEVKDTKTETKTEAKSTKKEHHKKAAKGKDASCKGKEGSCKAK